MYIESDHGDLRQLRHFVYGLNPLLSYLRDQGQDPIPFLNRASIPIEALNSTDQSISPAQEIELTMNVYRALKTQELGLVIGPRYHLSSYGMFGLAAISSATLRDCYQVVLENILLTWTYFKVSVYDDEDKGYLQMAPVRDLGQSMQFMLDRDLSAAWGIACDALGQTLPLISVELEHPRPQYAHLYEALFNCPIHFDADHNRLSFESRWFNQPLPEAEPDTSRVFANQCRDIVRKLQSDNSFSEHIRYFLLASDRTQPSLKMISKATNTSARTIQRKLAAEGTNFQAVLDNVRMNVASEFLTTTTLSIEMIAERLGFSDAAAFSHSFKRLSGKTPSAYRNSD